MKKSFLNSIIPLAIFMLYISINGYSQIQNPNWVLFTTGDSTATIGTTNIRFNSAPTIHYNENNTSYKNTPGRFLDENNLPITNYRGFNSFFDNDGFPVLYVFNVNHKTYIFDKHGKKYKKKHENPKGILHYFKNVTGGSNLDYYDNKEYIEGFNEELIMGNGTSKLENTSREISILKVGCNLLHVIAGSMIIEVDLSLKSWDYFIPYVKTNSSSYTSEFLGNKGLNSIMSGNGSITYRESIHSVRRDQTNEGKYYIYYLYSIGNTTSGENPTYLNTITVDATNYTVSYGPSFDLKHQNLANKFGIASHFTSELEVSPDGSKIAIHDRSDILVYNINANSKQVTSLLGWYLFAPASLQNFSLSGMEFSSNSNKLVFNRFNSGEPQYTQVLNNIGVLDLNNITNGQFACSWVYEDPVGKTQSIISRGGLELGRDGFIYSVGERELYKLNLNTLLLEPFAILQTGKAINLSNDSYLGGSYSIRALPEQIDGQTFIPEGYHLDDDDFLVPNEQVIFNGSNISGGILKIRGEIKINSKKDQPVIFNNITINPANGTSIRIVSGSDCLILNTNIQTDNCNKMWQGIIVEDGGGLKILNGSGEEKYIKDAILAVDYRGKESGLNINNYTFNRNERTIKITDGYSTGDIEFWGNIQIYRNNFKNTEVLKDLTKGQSLINQPNANKGVSSLEIINSGTLLKHIKLNDNKFDGGLFGIMAKNSFVNISGGSFSNIKGIASLSFLPRINVNYGSAVIAEKSDFSNVKYSLIIAVDTTNSGVPVNFFENSRHITVYNGVNLKIQKTNFHNSYQKGIEWVKNKGCSLDITSSSFLNCANSSIYCDDNAFPVKLNTERTYIKIVGNTFRNDKFDLLVSENQRIFQFDANAVMINDLGKTANTGYNYLEVSDNQIYNLRTGIVVNGVTGGKLNNYLTSPEDKIGGIYNFNNNGPIIIRPNLSVLTPSGIQLVNSNKLAIFQNNNIINGNSNRIANNGNAIAIENSTNISIKSNSLIGKYGIRAKMNNIGSEILCNTFSRNRFGIMFSDKHMIRNSFVTHGIKTVESRSNKFLQTGISDLHWIEPMDNVKNWWVIENNGTLKEACYQAGTTKSCFGPFTLPGSSAPIYILKTLIKDYATDFCNGQFPAGAPNEILADSSSDPISQWELDFTLAINTLKNNPNGLYLDKVRIIKAIEYTQTNTFDSALKILNPTFENNLDQQYASLLKKYIGFYYPTPRMPDSLEKSEIKAIAQQIPSEKGSHVYLARSIMQSLYDEQFAEKDIAYQDILIELRNTSCVSSDSNLKVVMLHANGTEIPIQYAFDEQYHLQIFGESLHELPSNETFLVRITHQGISYPLSKSLGNFFNTKNSIALECNANLGKRSNTEKQITQEGAAISVFPNPVSQYLSIKGIPETDNLCDISMLDMLGRSVLEVKQHPANKDLDVSKLPSGVYCLIIKQGHQHHRFLLNKE